MERLKVEQDKIVSIIREFIHAFGITVWGDPDPAIGNTDIEMVMPDEITYNFVWGTTDLTDKWGIQANALQALLEMFKELKENV